jgi:hypothetical protein
VDGWLISIKSPHEVKLVFVRGIIGGEAREKSRFTGVADLVGNSYTVVLLFRYKSKLTVPSSKVTVNL